MKYSALINLAGIEDAGLSKKTDAADWIILEYIYDWSNSGEAIKVGDHVWINYSHMSRSLPLLPVASKDKISRRFKKLRELGLIVTTQASDGRIFAKTTQLYFNITKFRASSNPSNPLPKTQHPVTQNATPPLPKTQHSVENQVLGNQDNVGDSGESTPPAAEDETGKPTPGWVIDRYHDRFPYARSVEKLTSKRRSHLAARIKNDLTTRDDWERYFDVVEASSFLMGRQPPGAGRNRPFRLSIDFLINETRCADIMEGKYDDD